MNSFRLVKRKGGQPMTSQLLLDKTELELALEDDQAKDKESADNITSYHDCLIGNYTSYLKAAGYSKLPQEMRIFERGARRFLSNFPDPQDWLVLSVEEQYRCDHKERSFVHYLISRRLLPMPLSYMLTPKPRFYQMAIRLMERETFQLYQQAAQRLGYKEQNIKGQFCALLCLMTWTQKPIVALTLDDLDAFIRELRTAYLSVKRQRRSVRNGLPSRWDNQLICLRNVLYHLGIFPQLTRSTRRTTFEKQWKDIPQGIAAPVHRYLQQMGLSLRPESAYQEKTRLFRFFSWLAQDYPEIVRIDQIRRCHIEAFKEYLRWVPPQHKSNRVPGDVLCSSSRYHLLAALYYFFDRIAEWQWPEAPKHVLIFTGDFPILDKPLPKFLDEVSAARFLEAARNHPDLFTRLCGVTLILTGMRQGEFPPHRLRHTLATLAVNRGMPLESIAALLGHRSLSMTMVYARIGNRTVQQEYSQVSQHLEELSRAVLPGPGQALVEGNQMRRLRQDHWRMLGNGYCTRPDGVPCEYETICESCPCFSTTVEFLPILNK